MNLTFFSLLFCLPLLTIVNSGGEGVVDLFILIIIDFVIGACANVEVATH